PFPVRFGPDRVVVIARIRRVYRDDGQMAQILAMLLAQRQLRRDLGLGDGLFAEDVGDAVLVDRDQAEAFRGQRIAENFDHPDARARRAAGLGEHELAGLRPAEIGDRRGVAHALVGRREPGLSAAVELDHAEQPLAARGELLHRVGGPAAAGLLGAREHAIPDLERGVALALDEAQAGRRGSVVGLPGVGDRDCLALVDVDHAQHGNLGHPAHAVEGRLLAVYQAFLGHVLQQPLERDALLALEAESLGDLALARGPVGGLDELDNLLARGETEGFAGAWRHGGAYGGYRRGPQATRGGGMRCRTFASITFPVIPNLSRDAFRHRLGSIQQARRVNADKCARRWRLPPARLHSLMVMPHFGPHIRAGGQMGPETRSGCRIWRSELSISGVGLVYRRERLSETVALDTNAHSTCGQEASHHDQDFRRRAARGHYPFGTGPCGRRARCDGADPRRSA